MPADESNSEWLTRKRRIDPQLHSAGWPKGHERHPGAHRIEEFETDAGPADYAQCIDERALGIVEAKKLSLGPQNVLTQAERYSKGASTNPFNFAGYRVPFPYATNGDVIWFHDVRHRLSRSRRLAAYHNSIGAA